MQQSIEGTFVLHEDQDASRCLIISGSVHGNEPAGAKAIKEVQRLVTCRDWVVQGGAVYGLIGNPRARELNKRFIEENLNRAFGRAENPDSYEAKRAVEVTQWMSTVVAKHKETYLLDLHSVSMGEVRVAIFTKGHEHGEKWCKTISPIPFKIGNDEKVLPGTLMGAIETLGGTGVSIECGNHSSETGAVVALEHIENALESLGILTEKKISFKGTLAYEGTQRTYVLTDIIKPAPGFVFTRPVASETFLKKDELYARDDTHEHRAPYDCYVIMPSKNPQPEDYDAGFLAVLEK